MCSSYHTFALVPAINWNNLGRESSFWHWKFVGWFVRRICVISLGVDTNFCLIKTLQLLISTIDFGIFHWKFIGNFPLKISMEFYIRFVWILYDEFYNIFCIFHWKMHLRRSTSFSSHLAPRDRLINACLRPIYFRHFDASPLSNPVEIVWNECKYLMSWFGWLSYYVGTHICNSK